jgi:hypothetical protein
LSKSDVPGGKCHDCHNLFRLQSVASVAQLAEQLTLKLEMMFSRLLLRSLLVSKRCHFRDFRFSRFPPFTRLASKFFMRDTIRDTNGRQLILLNMVRYDAAKSMALGFRSSKDYFTFLWERSEITNSARSAEI